jgi:hypothetical protein
MKNMLHVANIGKTIGPPSFRALETDDSIDVWDDGEEGNYWDNYTGLDSDENGVGDTPYIIDENNPEKYPLVESSEISEKERFPTLLAVAVTVTGVVIIAVGFLVYFNKRKR